ncbi:MAG: hypothetical protein HYX69_05740 [Planctomycetia bacterium]|nr:hypothetical protein [Planctomycetia bacterium]
MAGPACPSPWTLEELRPLRGYSIEWAEPGELILARRNELFRARQFGPPFESLGRVPAPALKAAASRFRPAQRALRFMFYNVLKLPDGRLFFTFDRLIGVGRDGRYEAISGLARPARVLRGSCALDSHGDVYFGEYVGNPQRHEIHVYRLPHGATKLEIVHTFAAGEVRHVHGIYADPFGGGLWCVTGDRTTECRVMRTMDRFRTIDVVGCGDETWRAVSLLFSPRGIYYGSDAEFIENHLYSIDRVTGERTCLSAIDGPVYYSCAVGDDLFFGVTAELCPSQKDRRGSLWHVRAGAPAARVLSIDKDALPVRYFQAGTWQFPRGPGWGDDLLVHLVALRGDNRTYALRRRRVAAASASPSVDEPARGH